MKLGSTQTYMYMEYNRPLPVETLDSTFEGLGEIFEGYSADMLAGKFLLVSMTDEGRVSVRRPGSEDPHWR